LETIELNATVRNTTGNGPARALRRQGRLPAVVYGPKADPIKLDVDIKELEQVFRKGKLAQTVLELVIDGDKKNRRPVMIKELQQHPVSGNFLHADFYEIDLKRKLSVMVPVVPKGISKGVEMGGIMNIVRREIEVLCLPSQIPEAIEVDVSELDIGDSIHVEDLPREGDIEIPAEVNFTVLTVVSPKMEEVEEEEEIEEGEEVEGEGETEASEEASAEE
jgi:large subunit ribosomal protein L25